MASQGTPNVHSGGDEEEEEEEEKNEAVFKISC